MLTIYHSAGTRGFRVMWVCEELGVPYETRTVDFSAQYRHSPEWRAIHPVSKVPVMDDTTGGINVRMHESGAMVQYILARYGEGRLQPADHVSTTSRTPGMVDRTPAALGETS